MYPKILLVQPSPNPILTGSVGTRCPQKTFKKNVPSLGKLQFTPDKDIIESEVKLTLQITVNNPKDGEYIAISGLDIDGSGLEVNKTALVKQSAFYFLTSNEKEYKLVFEFTDYETYYSKKSEPKVLCIELNKKYKLIKLPNFEHKYNCYIGVLKPQITKPLDGNIYLSDIFREDYKKIFDPDLISKISDPADKIYEYDSNLNVVTETMKVKKKFNLIQYTRDKLNIDFTYYFIIECHNSSLIPKEITLCFNGKNETSDEINVEKTYILNDLDDLKKEIESNITSNLNYSFDLKYNDTPTAIIEFCITENNDKYKTYEKWVNSILDGSFPDKYVHMCIKNNWIEYKADQNDNNWDKSKVNPWSLEDLKKLKDEKKLNIEENIKIKKINRIISTIYDIDFTKKKNKYILLFFKLELDFLWNDKMKEITSIDISIDGWKKHLKNNFKLIKNYDTYLNDFIKNSMFLDLSGYCFFVYNPGKNGMADLNNWKKEEIINHSIPLVMENDQVVKEIKKFKNGKMGYIIPKYFIINNSESFNNIQSWKNYMGKIEHNVIKSLVTNSVILNSLKETSIGKGNYIEETSWCSAYVNWVLKENGIESHDSAAAIDNYFSFEKNDDIIPGNQSIFSICLINSDVGRIIKLWEEKYIKMFKSFLESNPKNEILIRNTIFKNQHHITFAFSIDKKDSDKLVCLGGNQGNALRTTGYENQQIMAFLQPRFLKKLSTKLPNRNETVAYDNSKNVN